MKKRKNRRAGRGSDWRPVYKRASCGSLTSVESTRFSSLRVVNNGDGDDNEAIYAHALARARFSIDVAAI